MSPYFTIIGQGVHVTPSLSEGDTSLCVYTKFLLHDKLNQMRIPNILSLNMQDLSSQNIISFLPLHNIYIIS
jgi:hypothetical protein